MRIFSYSLFVLLAAILILLCISIFRTKPLQQASYAEPQNINLDILAATITLNNYRESLCQIQSIRAEATKRFISSGGNYIAILSFAEVINCNLHSLKELSDILVSLNLVDDEDLNEAYKMISETIEAEISFENGMLVLLANPDNTKDAGKTMERSKQAIESNNWLLVKIDSLYAKSCPNLYSSICTIYKEK